MSIGKTSQQNNPLSYKEFLLFYEKIFSTINAKIFVFDLVNQKVLWVNKSAESAPNEQINVLQNIQQPRNRDLLNEMHAFFYNNPCGTYTAVFKFQEEDGPAQWICMACNVFCKQHDDSKFEIVGVSIDLNHDICNDKAFSSIVKEKIVQKNNQLLNKLSKRELQLVKYFSRGCPAKEIAEELNLSVHTVNNHRKSILTKLGFKNFASFVSFAIENGIN